MVDGCAVHRPRQPDGDRSAAPQSAVELHGAVLQVDEALHQGQPDSSAFDAAPVRALRAKEPLPQPLQVGLRDTDTGVTNHDAAGTMHRCAP